MKILWKFLFLPKENLQPRKAKSSLSLLEPTVNKKNYESQIQSTELGETSKREIFEKDIKNTGLSANLPKILTNATSRSRCANKENELNDKMHVRKTIQLGDEVFCHMISWILGEIRHSDENYLLR